MVKRGFPPCSFVMAFVALRAFLPFVRIILLVTAVAVRRGIFVAVLGMTFLAGDFPMFPAERILCFAVIETNLLPSVVVMASRAGFSSSPFMLIVFLVAGVAGRRCLSIFRFGLVAGFAFNLPGIRMRAAEGKIRFEVVKRLFIDRGDIFGPAFVFGMAFFTFALLLHSSVKTLLLHDVPAHIFMAVLAKLCLRGFVESFMASGAVFFPFSMAFDDLPRHERRFNGVSQGC